MRRVYALISLAILGATVLAGGRGSDRQVRVPQPAQEFTIDELGGWSTVKDKFFDDTSGIMAKVEQSIGVSTSG